MGFKWENAWLSNGIHTYPTNGMLMLVMVCSLSINGMSGVYSRAELRLGLGWGYLVLSVRLTHSYTSIVNYECEAHSHLSYHTMTD